MLELNKIYQGDCLEKLKELPDNSVDSIITDPPYELGFMGKKWDGTGIVYNVDLWKECLRVLKHGGHLLSFGGTRTYHRMTCAIEDAGFEIRDCIQWVYGSGFPKSLNIGKAVDKIQGNEREVIGISENEKDFRDVGKKVKEIEGIDKLSFGLIENAERKSLEITKGNSEFEGWGTALKPANEPIVMARKPLSEKTVAENVLKWGTGGINIDGCRIPCVTEKDLKEAQSSRPSLADKGTNQCAMGSLDRSDRSDITGRFPANVIHDGSDEVLELFPDTKSQGHWSKTKTTGFGEFGNGKSEYLGVGEKDKVGGSASRFFYCAKASKSERNEGLDGFEEKQMDTDGNGRNQAGFNSADRKPMLPRANHHPTVKPVKLMRYLVRLVTPKGGTVLDPFTGSGTTGVACIKEGFNFIGIEKEEEYCKIAKARLNKQLEQTKLNLNETWEMVK